MKLDLIFCDINKTLVDEFQKHLSSFGKVIHGSIVDLEVDAIVSPANSYGFMDGGIDYVYSKHFGWDVQKKLQERIRTEFNGELLVGQATEIETNNQKIPYVISAPTMRVPMDARGTVNAFLATKAVLNLLTNRNNKIKSVAFPGLCTGVGMMPFDTCAIQMSEAIKDQSFPDTWQEAQSRHWKTALAKNK